MVIHWNPTPSRPALPPRHIARHAAPSPRLDRHALTILVAVFVFLALILAAAAPARAAQPLPGQPFFTDQVRVLDGSVGNARVRAGVQSWTVGTGVTVRWVEPEWAWGIYVRPDHDHTLGAALGGYRMTRQDNGWVESCTVLYRPGLAGAQLQTIVSRYFGRCLGWTGPARGRSVFRSEPAPTKRDLSVMRRIYATNP